ncbi:MAG: DUF3489 domain-containing protein [Pseudomonadota bacterium]
MTTLTDTQLLVLSAAAQRAGRLALPLPEGLKGGAAAKVVGALLRKGLLEEIEAAGQDPVWRRSDDGYDVTLMATHAAMDAIGVEPDGPDSAPAAADKAPSAEAPADAPAHSDPAPTARTPRAGTKQAKLIEMLEAPDGATIAEIAEATGWQPHTVRGAIAGALKKRLGLNVTSEKVEGRGRVYFIKA